jgi:GT2 family glycosyltransferase/glycosyltransferase involved in cell wall biosynthesis
MTPKPEGPDTTDADRIAELEAAVAGLEEELARSRWQLNAAAETRRSTTDELSRVRGELRALNGRTSVRVAVAAADEAGGAYRLARRIRRGVWRRVKAAPRKIRERVQQRNLRATPAAEAALVEALRASLPATTIDHGPLVSIIILNRDGREHLERCLTALASTAYRDLEVIVVDNGSSDGSAELAESFRMPFPLRLVRNKSNRSFSEANGQGVALAGGELLCFLNNDVDPITDQWLGYMVETLQDRDATAVGARLIYPSHRGGTRAGKTLSDLSIQHAGVDFERVKGMPVARAVGAGEEALVPWAGEVVERPALTAACLLVRRDAFEQVGGFSRGYDYGIEDVDLCLKLQAAGGRLVYDGRAALWHHESATRASDRARYSERSASNRELFTSIWGPRIYRATLVDALESGRRFSSDPFHIAIAAPAVAGRKRPAGASAAAGIKPALEAFDWRVEELATNGSGWETAGKSVETILVLDPTFDLREHQRGAITVAWIEDDPEAWLGQTWFDEFDLVLTSSDDVARQVREGSAKVARLLPRIAKRGRADDGRYVASAAAIREALMAWASATRYGLRIGVTSWGVIDRWGDYFFARGLQRYLERAGHPTRLHFLRDWPAPHAARDDVAVHLFGLKEAPTHRGQVNVLWQISHPDLATPELYERYDHVFVASDRFAARMADQVSVPVESLHQATDPERFKPEPGGPRHELLFVANSRKVRRRIVDDLADTKRDLAIYGRDWTPDLADPRFVKGEVVKNAELARYYSAADVVLNDHWDDMRIEGFLSNRLYDALACGAFVVSDLVDGIEAEFDGAIATYASQPELEPLIARYLANPDERQRLAAHGRAIVLERHTFDHRVRALCAVADPLARARPQGIEDVPRPSGMEDDSSVETELVAS